ncbi:tellurite resistance protein TehB [Phycisphaerae bacterium RAS2]|nr:tellurite resistance protein TehB [Phycisphaerae bacterium RAS2]
MQPSTESNHSISGDSPFLDVRLEAEFLSAHHPHAVNIPLEELVDRIHELPPPYETLWLFDADSQRAGQAERMLRERDRMVAIIEPGDPRAQYGSTVSGASTARLWRPHRLMHELLAAMRAEWGDVKGRTALDVACGAGRDAVFLAEHSLQVTAWDILPDAVARCEDLARRTGVTLAASARDITVAGEILPDSVDIVCCFNFLHRPLMPSLAEAVRPGGFVCYETFVDPQRERFGKPTRPERVLRPGELAKFFKGWTLLVSREGLVSPRRIAASLIAQRPVA